MDTEMNYFGDQADEDLDELTEGRGEDLGREDDDDDSGHGRDDEAEEAPAPKKKDGSGKDDATSKKKREPRPKLDSNRLAGPRGLLALEAKMRDVQLQGKKHELEDLTVLLSQLQHWAHRLFPSYTFDDCLDKLEKLGSKKSVALQVKKIRLGMTSVDDLHDTTLRGEDYVEEQEDQPAPQRNPEEQFNNLMATARPEQTAAAPLATQPAGLTEEQKARMLRNRLAAEKLRLERLKERQELEQRALEEAAAVCEIENMEEDM